MNLCHPVFPSPLGKQRTNRCRKSGLFVLTVRNYRGEINGKNLASPYSDNQTTCSFMWFAEWEQIIYILKTSSQTPNQTHNAVFLWVAEARESQWMQTRPQEWDRSETKHSVLCRTALSEACRFPLRGWERTTSLHPGYPALFFSVGWDRRYQCELDSRHLQSGDV